ncbi:MAG: hypothetical protein WDW38_006465 [Sanguina aurantia]
MREASCATAVPQARCGGSAERACRPRDFADAEFFPAPRCRHTDLRSAAGLRFVFFFIADRGVAMQPAQLLAALAAGDAISGAGLAAQRRGTKRLCRQAGLADRNPFERAAMRSAAVARLTYLYRKQAWTAPAIIGIGRTLRARAHARGVESRLGLVINMVASLFSAIIPSQALAALMIPVSSRLSARTGVPLSKLLLPMAFCILTATNTTLIANSPLIVLNTAPV